MNRENSSTFYPKKLTNMEWYNLGISQDNLNVVSTLDDLRRNPPNTVIAECIKSVKFVQNKFREQELIKKSRYVMGLGVYIQLHYDTRIKQQILKPSEIQFRKNYRPYLGQDLTNKTLLVFRTGGLGDLLFISPNLKYLKEKYPTCKIKFACGPQYQDMIREWRFVDEILDLPFALNHLFKSDYHAIFEGVIERCKEAEIINSYKLFTKWLGLNLSDELLVPKQEPNEETLQKCKNILEDDIKLKEKDFIIVQMRASSIIRTPRPEIWVKIINELTEKGHNILITDSPYLSSDIDQFIKKLKNQNKVINFCKYSTSIDYSISMTSLAKLTIGTDSALGHISISVGTPFVGIYGPFIGEVRLSTYPKNLCDWVNVQRECAPCFKHGMDLCKNSKDGFVQCFDNINYDEVLSKVERFLNV